MAATGIYKAPEGLTVEQFWEMFYAKIAEHDERNKEYERKREQEKAEFDRKWAKTMEAWEKADRRIQETNRELGGISNTFGEVIEHLVLPGIEERFEEMGLRFNQVSARRKLKDSCGNVVAEIDLLLENDDMMVAVETKGKPGIKDIERHGGKLEKLREWLGGERDRRRIMGAVAGAVFASGERLAALEAGFYVIVQSGDTMRMDIPEGFKPKVWEPNLNIIGS